METGRERVLREVVQAQDVLTGLFLAYTRDLWAAEDLYQDMVVLACEKYEQADLSRPLRPWLLQIARNLARDRLRRESRLSALSPAAERLLEDPAWEQQELGSEERRSALRRCLERLGRSARRLVEAKYVERLSGAELAGRLGLKVESVYTALARVRRKLTECVETHLAGPGGRTG